jgi:hypothetical protein
VQNLRVRGAVPPIFYVHIWPAQWRGKLFMKLKAAYSCPLTAQWLVCALPASNIRKQEGKAISLQARTGPEGFRRLRLPDFKIIGT